MSEAVVGIIMGSDSDLDVMAGAAKVLDEFSVPYEVRIISAHRTPKEMLAYAAQASSRGLKVIIAGAGGSAHLPGMTASETSLPVLAVPVKRDNHDHEAQNASRYPLGHHARKWCRPSCPFCHTNFGS
jgi:phosphoribosylaminoimidazole carboxylase PurE protein